MNDSTLPGYAEVIKRHARDKHVCIGSLADVAPRNCDVCFTPESRHCSLRLARPLSANNGHHFLNPARRLLIQLRHSALETLGSNQYSVHARSSALLG